MPKTPPQKTEKKPKSDYNSPAVDKAVDVIEYLASRREAVSITAMSEGIGRSVGEIYRVVRALERRRLVYKDPNTERFQLSLRLFELAHKFPPVERLARVAQFELDALAEKTLQSCHLAVVEGSKIMIVAAKESPLPMHYGVRVGSAFRWFDSSSGTLIVAFSSEQQRQFLLAGLKKPERTSLESRFGQIVEGGYELRESDAVEGLSNITVPVRSQEGKILAALTVPYLKQSTAPMGPRAVLEMQIAASERISRRLG